MADRDPTPQGPLGWDDDEPAGAGPRSGRGTGGGSGRPGAGMARRYSFWVAALFVGLVVIAAVVASRNSSSGSLGVRGSAGEPLSEFAVPAIPGSLTGDANVAQDDCASGELPCDERRTPACKVNGPSVIRVCDLFDKPLLISFWFSKGTDCATVQDRVQATEDRYGRELNVLSLNTRDERAEVERIVGERGWTMPVGHDADGAVGGLYGVGLCPTLLYALPGGIVFDARIGQEAVRDLDRDVKRLLSAARSQERAQR
ncbi:MAG: TlpA family protein disulfide reductase [Solirubrobacterales bacterium]